MIFFEWLKTFFALAVLLTVALLVQPLSVCVALAQLETVRTPREAWSGYWWPYTSGGLATGADYRGNPAPLEKYELLTDGYLSDRLVSLYLERYYDPAAPGWYGLCYAWAAASTFEVEPALPSVHDNLLFRVGDKKGLYTLAHTNNVNIYGLGQDPYEFHRWLTQRIGQQSELFYADLDAGPEVWSYPIYGYDMEYGERVGSQQAVQVWIYYANDFVALDFVGTDVEKKLYTYTLEYDSNGILVDAEWTGESLTDHPQLMTAVQHQRSRIEGLDMELLRAIGQSADDELEQESQVQLAPGSYQLISLDEDRYLLQAREGDVLRLEALKLPGAQRPVQFQVEDGAGLLLDSFTLSSAGEVLDWTLTGSADGRYQLRVTQPDYAEAEFYQLDVNLRGGGNEQLLPYMPMNGWWNGLALTNMADTATDMLTLTSQDASGRALQTHLQQNTLPAREKIVTLFENLPARLNERSTRDCLALFAGSQVAVVNLFGGAEDGLGGFFSADDRLTQHLVLPLARADWREVVWGGLLNRSDSRQMLTCSLYGADGSLVASQSVELEPWSKLALSGLSIFSKMPAGGWIDVRVDSGDACLAAYQLWRSLANVARIEGLRGLAPAALQWLPHVEDAGFWSTLVTLVNPQAVELSLTIQLWGQEAVLGPEASKQLVLAPFEKRQLRLAELFAAGVQRLPHCAVRFSADLPFAALATYDSSEDLAHLPLVQADQLGSRLCLSHLALTHDWWTGVALFNPQMVPVTINLTPVTVEGRQAAELSRTLVLQPGEKQAFSLLQFWSQTQVEGFSHLECVSAGGEQVGGLFLFGRFGVRQVAGSLLPLMPAE